MASKVCTFENQLSGSASNGAAPHAHSHDNGLAHSHDHGPNEHGHTHEIMEHAGECSGGGGRCLGSRPYLAARRRIPRPLCTRAS